MGGGEEGKRVNNEEKRETSFGHIICMFDYGMYCFTIFGINTSSGPVRYCDTHTFPAL